MSEIYIIWDRHFGIVWGATTNYGKAMRKRKELNDAEGYSRYEDGRYIIGTFRDFAVNDEPIPVEN